MISDLMNNNKLLMNDSFKFRQTGRNKFIYSFNYNVPVNILTQSFAIEQTGI